MLTPLLLTLALASAPKVAVVAVGGAETIRDRLDDALAADPSVAAQPRQLVDEVLAASAAAGLVCTVDDLPCWTKVGLDGELDLLVVAVMVSSGALELRVVDIATGREARRVTVEPEPPFDAAATVASLLHPPPPPPPPGLPPPTKRAPHPPPPPKPAAAPHPDVEQPGPASMSLMLLGAAGGAAVVGVTCGVAAARVDVSLSEMLVAAKDTGAPLDRPSYRDQENAQNLLIVCGAVAGAAAIASAASALVVE